MTATKTASKKKVPATPTVSREYIEIAANGTHGELVLFVSVHVPGKRGGAGAEVKVSRKQLAVLLSNAVSIVNIKAAKEVL